MGTFAPFLLLLALSPTWAKEFQGRPEQMQQMGNPNQFNSGQFLPPPQGFNPNQAQEKEGGFQKFFHFLGFGSENSSPPPMPSPCYSPTTPAPIPLNIPPCPFQPPPQMLRPRPEPSKPEPEPEPEPEPRPPPPSFDQPQRPQQNLPPPPQNLMPYSPELMPQPSEIEPYFSCGFGPYVPPGFFVGNATMDACGHPANQPPPCPTLEMFERLQLFKIRDLIREARLESLFTQTSGYTFFAPVDPAFDRLPHWFLDSLRKDNKLLQAFVLNHFVKEDVHLPIFEHDFQMINARAGGNRLRFNTYFPDTQYRIYTVDGSRLLRGDIRTVNGRIHILDKVLTPNPKRNIAQYLTEVPDFSEFWGAVQESGLVPLFQQEKEPITLFIPYNPAFKHFDFEAMRGNRTALQNFVKYHVVPGVQYSSGLITGQFLFTHYEKEVKVSVASDGFSKTLSHLNGHIEVFKADIPLVNGVAHVINRAITNEPAFFFIEEFNEFSYEFGALRRSFEADHKDHK